MSGRFRENERRDFVSSHVHSLSTVCFMGQTPALRASQVVLVVKTPPANLGDVGDTGLIPGSGRSPGGGHSNPLHDYCLEKPMERGACRATVHGVKKSQTQLKRFSTHTRPALKQPGSCWMRRSLPRPIVHGPGVPALTTRHTCGPKHLICVKGGQLSRRDWDSDQRL